MSIAIIKNKKKNIGAKDAELIYLFPSKFVKSKFVKELAFKLLSILQAKEEKPKLQEQLQILTQTLEEATGKAGEESLKKQLKQCERDVDTAANTLSKSLDENCTKVKQPGF